VSAGDAGRATRIHRVRVRGLPVWVDRARLLGPGEWRERAEQAAAAERSGAGAAERAHPASPEARGSEPTLVSEAALDTTSAADLAARLRGVGLGGRLLAVEVEPPLPRTAVRAARTEEARRYRAGSEGFTRKAARLDAEGRRSLTPEALALELGQRARGLRVLDACAGAGGNAIGFARAGCHVTAVELDAGRLALARHNARLYGVQERIRFVHGDARLLVASLSADLLFVDPPWGASYDKARVVAAELPLLTALLAHAERFAATWLKLPPSFDPTSVPGALPSAWFGSGQGDARRVKLVLLTLGSLPARAQREAAPAARGGRASQRTDASSSKRAKGASAARVRSTASRAGSGGGASGSSKR
jgi:predicted RNA methylase